MGYGERDDYASYLRSQLRGNQQVQDTIWEICMENMEHFLNQEPLQHVVDLEAGY